MESEHKCVKGVLWKGSVAAFDLNKIALLKKLSDELHNDTYRPLPPRTVLITYPKRRVAVSIAFRDRIYQRSLNDNIVYPLMTRSFIYDNCACQKGKGSDFARGRLKCHIQKCFRKNGMDFWVLQCDIKHYYDNMRHDTTEALFREHLPPRYGNMVAKVLNEQYQGDVGFNPGSQMIQIAGISVLDKLDHKIKERMHIKHYLRYMDDFILMHPDKEYLLQCKKWINEELSKIGLSLHEKKTKLYHISKGVDLLGFHYKLFNTGKVTMSVLGQNVKHERRKLRKMVKLVKTGRIPKSRQPLTKQRLDMCYQSWKAHIAHGNSHKLQVRMDKFYKDLWR